MRTGVKNDLKDHILIANHTMKVYCLQTLIHIVTRGEHTSSAILIKGTAQPTMQNYIAN
jgi:hypothetical protein